MRGEGFRKNNPLTLYGPQPLPKVFEHLYKMVLYRLFCSFRPHSAGVTPSPNKTMFAAKGYT